MLGAVFYGSIGGFFGFIFGAIILSIVDPNLRGTVDLIVRATIGLARGSLGRAGVRRLAVR